MVPLPSDTDTCTRAITGRDYEDRVTWSGTETAHYGWATTGTETSHVQHVRILVNGGLRFVLCYGYTWAGVAKRKEEDPEKVRQRIARELDQAHWVFSEKRPRLRMLELQHRTRSLITPPCGGSSPRLPGRLGNESRTCTPFERNFPPN